MVKQSCDRPARLGDANNYLRKKLNYMQILKICYKLGIYTKCLPKTYILLSPKLSKKNKCRDYVSLFEYDFRKGYIDVHMPQLIRHKSMMLF
uniref:RNA-directed DNA polymerase-like protein n=1 Tax=Strongyloides venezuelensis TaxID=75913 RepID=A0A0K0FSU8_STRVS